jgi:DNA-binding Lrp family transcriptional regulator
MSKTILTQVEGWTPLIDKITVELGLITSAVFGVVWRKCQMKDGVCKASVETLAGDVGLSTRTIIRHLDALVEAGYLKDLTPGLKNRPHIYADTGKIQMKSRIEAGMTESHSTMTESHGESDTESEHAMTESQLNKTTLRDKEETIKDTQSKGLSHIDELDPDSLVTKLSKQFEVSAQITARDPERWLKACRDMCIGGVSPELLGRTVFEMRNPPPGGKKLTVTGPWSCVNIAIGKAAELRAAGAVVHSEVVDMGGSF